MRVFQPDFGCVVKLFGWMAVNLRPKNAHKAIHY